jgi:N-acetylmuramic acid 6-phosphate etherase
MRKKNSKQVYDEISRLLTEERNPESMRVDEMSIRAILELVNREDGKVAQAVKKEIPKIEKAVQIVIRSLTKGGRLFYVGAGTSGRLGVIDAAECPPTYSTPPDMVQGIIAGGPKALLSSIEGAEDNANAGARELAKRGLTPNDVVAGIAASRRTPFVAGALQYARKVGAKTIHISCNPKLKVDIPVDVSICPTPGPEVVTGSTRMKAGTAQKMVLNMITTTSMIRMGKVYENLMVDLQPKSQKLRERSKRIMTILGGMTYEEASRTLRSAGGDLKTAIVMVKTGEDVAAARGRLAKAGSNVKRAIRGN